jgi:glutamate synthase domain-containing protein 2
MNSIVPMGYRQHKKEDASGGGICAMERFLKRHIGKVGQVAIAATSVYAGYHLLQRIGRWSLTAIVHSFASRLLKDTYDENLWELIHAGSRVTPQTVVEIALRAESGHVITRPLGSRRRYAELDTITFDIAQLAREARPANLSVNTAVVLGPQAQAPLRLEIPIMIAGMGYGLALSGPAKIALANGARMAGTATNSGEGLIAPGELEAAGKYILQIGRSCWNREMSLIKRANMVQIQLGQGASGGSGHPVGYKDLSPCARRAFHLKKNEQIVIHTQLPEIKDAKHLYEVVRCLRQLTPVPIDLKIGAGKFLEEDMQMAIDAGVDCISIDGAQAGSHAAAPILMDDCGLPTFYALIRAANFLEQNGLKGKISLIVSGGLFTPGDFLKCLALGADAVAIGTAALLAISHSAVAKILPWEPPTQLVYATGKHKNAFCAKQGAMDLYYFLMSSVDEMVLGVRTLGKQSLTALDRSDLMGYDPQIAQVAGIDYMGTPQAIGRGSALQPEWLRREHALAHQAAVALEKRRFACVSLFDLPSTQPSQ